MLWRYGLGEDLVLSFAGDQLRTGPLNDGDPMPARTAAAAIGRAPRRQQSSPSAADERSRSRVAAGNRKPPVMAAAAKRASCGSGMLTLAPSLLPHCQIAYIGFGLWNSGAGCEVCYL